MFAIRRTDQGGGYVADMRKSKGSSYTNRIERAALFATREEADKARCIGNEVVIDVNALFKI